MAKMTLNELMTKMQTDDDLRQRFQAAPMALLDELGFDTSTMSIVDPSASEDSVGELSDEDLASVAGGTGIAGCMGIGISENIPWGSAR